MEMLKPPPPLLLQGDASENYKKWKQKFDLYLLATGSSQKMKEDEKIALFLHCMGEEGIEIYNNFEFSNEEEKSKFSIITEKFQTYFVPQKSETITRNLFFKRKIKENETFDEYLNALRTLSNDCNFGPTRDSLIKDQIIRGIKKKNIVERLLKEYDLDLSTCIRICKSYEAMEKQISNFETEDFSSKVDAVNKKKGRGELERKGSEASSSTKESATRRKITACGRCGYEHGFKCPAFNQKCKRCSKFGHYSKMCRNIPRRVNEVQHSGSESNSEDSFVLTIQVDSVNKCDLFESIQINNKLVDFKLDTGSDCDVLPLSYVKKLGLESKIDKNLGQLYNYDGSKINCVGKIKTYGRLVNNQKYLFEFYVVDGNCASVLGYKTILNLNLLERKFLRKICRSDDYENLIKEYKDLFDEKGLGTLKGAEYKIQLKEDAVGKVEQCRGVPVSLKESVKKELNKMEKLEIIEKIKEPTEYVSNIVIVKKPNGKIRICLDPNNLNKNIKREHFKLPTFEEVSSKMAGSTVFSKLDASTAFFQVKLEPESAKLCTFTTPFGRYYFKRLPYGLSSAPEVFHRQYKEIFENIEGCEVFVDDIAIYGKNKCEHDERLLKVLKVARENGVRFNMEKCEIGKTEIQYLGHTLSANGIKPDQKKVEAILNLKKPENPKEVQRLLGMITYVAKFIPSLSQVCAPLRKLIKKGIEWSWTKEQDDSFQELKNILISEPVLQFYDENKPIKLSVDASKDALGAVLLQKNLPVAYASKSMTNTQKMYAQIEKELLAIVFGCSRFHQYIYGKQIEVETDHRPLESIFRKSLCDVPLRLQRMRLHLQKYDIIVKYKPGKDLLIADALSRDCVYKNSSEEKILETEVEAHVGLVINALPITSEKLKIFKDETKNDTELETIKQYILYGWPDIREVPNSLKVYYTFREDLYIYDDLIFKNNCLVVPKSLRTDMLERIHYNHLGLEKCKARARSCIFWPFMIRDLTNKILTCNTCDRYKRNNPKEPMIIREMPEKPWSHLGCDVFHYRDKNYLIVVDYYSKYFEIGKLKDLCAETTIELLKSIFSRFGIPEILYSDGATNFTSYKFKDFVNEWGFVHKTSSPTYPQSNGLAERYIQTVKNIFRKADYEKKDKYLALLEYRNTPISQEFDYKSPSELLMGRKTQGILPNFDQPSMENKNIQKTLYRNAFKQKSYYDRNTKKLSKLSDGQKVVLLDSQKKKPNCYAQVRARDARPNSYKIVTESGQELERNRRYLIDCKDQSKLQFKSDNDVNDYIQKFELSNKDRRNSEKNLNHKDKFCQLDDSINEKSFIEKRNKDDTKAESFSEKRNKYDTKAENENKEQTLQSRVYYRTRMGRNVTKPAYLSDYVS